MRIKLEGFWVIPAPYALYIKVLTERTTSRNVLAISTFDLLPCYISFNKKDQDRPRWCQVLASGLNKYENTRFYLSRVGNKYESIIVVIIINLRCFADLSASHSHHRQQTETASHPVGGPKRKLIQPFPMIPCAPLPSSTSECLPNELFLGLRVLILI